MQRINIGCGQTPTLGGWRNFDNSMSLRLARVHLIPDILHKLGLLEPSQYQFIQFARANNIEYGDATKGLPLKNDCCDVVYSSHMLEHLNKSEADVFVKEAYRVLGSNGVIRIAVPDIQKHVQEYTQKGDADAFMQNMHVSVAPPVSIIQKIIFLLSGVRHHLWMYDGRSLAALLAKHGFCNIEVLPPGTTKIPDPGALDLAERSSESVYVEGFKP